MNSLKHLAAWIGLLFTLACSGAWTNSLFAVHSEELASLAMEYQRVDVHIENQASRAQFSTPISFEVMNIAKLSEPAMSIRVTPKIFARRWFFFRNSTPSVQYLRELAIPPLQALERMAIINRGSGQIVFLSSNTVCRRLGYHSIYPTAKEFNPTAWIVKNSLQTPSMQPGEFAVMYNILCKLPPLC